MNPQITADTFVGWLAQEARALARQTSGGGDPFPRPWGVATDALDWLRAAPPDEREQALQSVQQ